MIPQVHRVQNICWLNSILFADLKLKKGIKKNGKLGHISKNEHESASWTCREKVKAQVEIQLAKGIKGNKNILKVC